MVAHLNGERSTIFVGHIGRIRGNDVEALGFDRREKIAAQKTNAVGDPVAFRICFRNGQRAWRDLDRGDMSVWQRMGQSYGNRARSAADIGNSNLRSRSVESLGKLD